MLVIVFVILRLPHLMLTHICHHNRVALGQAPDVVYDVCRIQVAGVWQRLDVAYCHVALH